MYNVLIVGAGQIASGFDYPESNQILTHAHAFSRISGMALKGFYDKNKSMAAAAASRWSCSVFSDFEEAMVGTDVICSCVPDNSHAEILMQAAKFPVRLVITEKPLVISAEEVERIRFIYEDKIPLAVNYSRRYLKEFQNLKRGVSRCGIFLKGVGYYGKGILHNGSHMIDLLRLLLGEIETIEASHHQINDFDSLDRSCDADIKISGGQFHLCAIDCREVTIFEMELFFSKARIRILDGGNSIEIYEVKESSSYAGYYNYYLKQQIQVDYSNAMLGLAENVKNYLDGREELLCTLQDGIQSAMTCLKIRGD